MRLQISKIVDRREEMILTEENMDRIIKQQFADWMAGEIVKLIEIEKEPHESTGGNMYKTEMYLISKSAFDNMADALRVFKKYYDKYDTDILAKDLYDQIIGK